MAAERAIDVVLCGAGPRNEEALAHTVFSLAGQEHHPVRLHLPLAGWAPPSVERVRAALAPVAALGPLSLEISAGAVDLAIAGAQGRYLAFIDCGDVLYPEGYRLLIERLVRSDAAIAFAATNVKRIERHGEIAYVRSKSLEPGPTGLADLLGRAKLPAHGHVIDRARAPRRLLAFDAAAAQPHLDLARRLSAEVAADFALARIAVGDSRIDAGEPPGETARGSFRR
jgi:hypothetical protein